MSIGKIDKIEIDGDVFEKIYFATHPVTKTNLKTADEIITEYEGFTRYVNSKKIRPIFETKKNYLTFDVEHALSLDGWTGIKINEVIRKILEEYLNFFKSRSFKDITTIDDLLKAMLLESFFHTYNGKRSMKYYDTFVSEYFSYHNQLWHYSKEKAKNTGNLISIPIKKSTRALLNQIKDYEHFDNINEAILFVITVMDDKPYTEWLITCLNDKTYFNQVVMKHTLTEQQFEEKLLKDTWKETEKYYDYMVKYIFLKYKKAANE